MRSLLGTLLVFILSSQTSRAAILQVDASAQAAPGTAAIRIHPTYPAAAKAKGVSGTVTVEAVIGKDGSITALRATEGPAELRKETLRAVSLWTFNPVSINGQPAEVSKFIKIKFFLGDSKDTDSTGVDLVVGTNQEAIVLRKVYTAKPLPPGRVRLTPFKAEALLTNQVKPTYPPSAKEAGVTGDVVLTAVVDKSGKVTETELVSGSSLFRDAAIAAVRQWTYKPYIVDGEPKEVETTVVVHFQ